MKHSFYLADEQATTELAAKLAALCSTATVIYLEGDLGAGKTSFCRGFIHGLGYVGRVKSPTYTLVEPYGLSDPEELEFIGIRDYFDDDCICLIEWPDKGHGLLAAADLHISIEFIDHSRSLTVQANNEYGQQLLSDLAQK